MAPFQSPTASCVLAGSEIRDRTPPHRRERRSLPYWCRSARSQRRASLATQWRPNQAAITLLQAGWRGRVKAAASCDQPAEESADAIQRIIMIAKDRADYEALEIEQAVSSPALLSLGKEYLGLPDFGSLSIGILRKGYQLAIVLRGLLAMDLTRWQRGQLPGTCDNGWGSAAARSRIRATLRPVWPISSSSSPNSSRNG